jgi:hypothetical protein
LTKNIDRVGGASVTVINGQSGSFGSDTLLYRTDRAGLQRIRPTQIAFVEFQHGSTEELKGDDLFFWAAPATQPISQTWVNALRSAGKIARLWEFNGAGLTHESATVSFPATDLPFAPWYVDYCRLLGCVR